MQSAALKLKTVHIVRIDPGEDVLASLRSFLAASGVRQAVVLGGYGTLAAHHLHWVKHNRLPAENLFRKGSGGIEILAMNGLVVDGEPHIHVALSTPAGAYGGHLEEGCITYVLCEVFLGELEGVELTRRRVKVNLPGMGEGEVTRLELQK